LKTTALLLCTLLLSGCSTPAVKNDDFAQAHGLQRLELVGQGFEHRVYLHRPGPAGRVWHVYIEGDGRPWLGRYLIAPDPTVNHPLMLQMLVRDAAPAIYLGRPCYDGHNNDPQCRPWYWTQGRYSEAVVASLATTLQRLIAHYRIDRLVLIGHSGGATLARLLAERIPQTQGLVTIAGNLDTDHWTARHGYSPLRGSLNPARRPDLPPSILQWHFTGARDRNIPPETARRLALRHPAWHYREFPDTGHVHGWNRHICEILRLAGGACRTAPSSQEAPGPRRAGVD